MLHTGHPLTLSLATAFGAYMLAAGNPLEANSQVAVVSIRLPW